MSPGDPGRKRAERTVEVVEKGFGVTVLNEEIAQQLTQAILKEARTDKYKAPIGLAFDLFEKVGKFRH